MTQSRERVSLRPTMMGIIEIDGVFSWSVSFANDPRLPRMGKASTFTAAIAAVHATIKKESRARQALATTDRRPPAAP